MKNINTTISDEIAEKMEKFPDVNWSAVTRNCIEQYIKQRTSEGLEEALSKIEKMKGREFKKGYEFVIQNSEAIGLAALEEINDPYHDPDADEDAHEHEKLLLDKILSRDIGDIILRYDKHNRYGKHIVENVRYKVSSSFREGMREAAKSLLRGH
jgi:transcription elongation factor GreA-like protein